MNNIISFNYDNKDIRTILIDQEHWFVAKDIALALGYNNTRDSIASHVHDDDKGVAKIDTLGGMQQMTIINESGVYALIFGSKLESAKKFKHWVTSEVLPSIRKTGSYSNKPMTIDEQIQLIAGGHIQVVKRVEKLEASTEKLESAVDKLEHDIPINRSQQKQLHDIKRDIVIHHLGGKNTDAYKMLAREAFPMFWSDIKHHFEVASYLDIPKFRFDEAKEFATMWQPNAVLMAKIRNCNNQMRFAV